MGVPLVRKPLDVDVDDATAVREALKERVDLEIKLRGHPHPRIYVLGDGWEESLDLPAMVKDDPGASLGATFQMLGRRPGVVRRLLVTQVRIEDEMGGEGTYAMVFEEVAEPGEPRRWWVSMARYRQDPLTQLGERLGDWQDASHETANPAHLFPFLVEVVSPPEGARTANVLAPRASQPDIQVAFGDIPPGVPTPADATDMLNFTAALVVNDLLSGRVKGTMVVRLAGRAWEAWVLGDELPSDLDDMIRYIANVHGPEQADAVALAMIAVRPQDVPPEPGVQVIAERDGLFVETWSPLQFPEGPEGPKVVGGGKLWGPAPVRDGGMWLGVEPNVEFTLGALGPEA